jgi:hypothetical protein
VTCEVNNSTCYNSLPYIQLSYPPVKLLIDTGCYKSIIRPGIAEKYFPFDIYHEPSKIKTSTGEKPIRFKAKTQAFPELNNDKIIEFLLFDFHEYFDGILGLKDLREMKLSINLVDKILTNGIMKIPFYYRQPDETSHTVSLNSHEILKTKLPVNCNNGDVIILEQTINDLYIPETLTTAKDGFALMEIHNRTDSRIDLILFEPLKTVHFSESNKERFEIFHVEQFFPETKKRMCNKTSRIENLIRTDHLNTEEKEAITSLCHEFSDIFHKDDDKLTFTNQIKHQIKTSDEIPIHTRSYRYPFVHKLEVKNQIDKMLKDGIIRPSQSPWSSPIWVVPKKIDASGKQKWRIVIDYRKAR